MNHHFYTIYFTNLKNLFISPWEWTFPKSRYFVYLLLCLQYIEKCLERSWPSNMHTVIDKVKWSINMDSNYHLALNSPVLLPWAGGSCWQNFLCKRTGAKQTCPVFTTVFPWLAPSASSNHSFVLFNTFTLPPEKGLCSVLCFPSQSCPSSSPPGDLTLVENEEEEGCCAQKRWIEEDRRTWKNHQDSSCLYGVFLILFFACMSFLY